MKFTNSDIQQITKKGLTVSAVESQIDIFKAGLPFVNLSAVATIGNGIKACSVTEKQQFIEHFDNQRHSVSIYKFVPASGAATRMFKTLFKFIEEYNPDDETINSYINRNKERDLSVFLVGIEKLPFYKLVLEKLDSFYPNYKAFSDDKQKFYFVKTMLDSDKFNYGFF